MTLLGELKAAMNSESSMKSKSSRTSSVPATGTESTPDRLDVCTSAKAG